MSGVAIRCPHCGVQQAALGACEACGHEAVRYFCGNHTPGRWLAGPSCDGCGARFGDPPRRPAAAPPASTARRPPAARAGARRPPVSLDRPDRPAAEPAGEEVVVWTPVGPRRVRVEREGAEPEVPEYLPPSPPTRGELVNPVESVARAAGAAVGCLARTAILLLLLLLFGFLFFGTVL